jgi:hypothetical protein
MRPLIGRSAELLLLQEWLDAGHRLIGVTGPPGVGKSALLEGLRRSRTGEAVERATIPRGQQKLFCVDDWQTWPASARSRLLAAAAKRGSAVVLASASRDVDIDATWLVVRPLGESETREMLDTELLALGVAPLEGGGATLNRLLQLTFGFPSLVAALARRLRTDSAAAIARSLSEDEVEAFFSLSPAAYCAELGQLLAALSPVSRRAAERLSLFEWPFPLDAGRAVLEAARLDRAKTLRAIDTLLDGQVLHLRGGEQRIAQLWGPVRAALIHGARRGRRWHDVEQGFAAVLPAYGRDLDPRDLLHAASWLAGAANSKLARQGGPLGQNLRIFSSRWHGTRNSPRWEGLARVVGEALLCALAPPPSHGAEALERLAKRLRDPNALTAVETARALALRSGDQLGPALVVLDGLGPVLPRAAPELQARALEARAVCARRARRLEDARASAERACELYRSLASDRLCHALGALAAIDLEEGALDDAYARFTEVGALAERSGDARAALLAAAFRAHVEQERGRSGAASAGYRDVHLAFAQRGEAWLAAVYRGYEATALEESARPVRGPESRELVEPALRAYDDAIRSLDAVEAASFATLFRAARSALAAELSLPDEGPRVFGSTLDDPAVMAAVAIHRRRFEIARGLPPSSHSLGPLMQMRALSDDVRFALRRLARVRAQTGQPTRPVLRLGTGLVQVDDGAEIDLRRRRVLWRILERLVATHLDEAGRETSAALLLSAGWGDERMQKTAAAHRLRVAISELRTLGLSGAIERADAGYRLKPELVVLMIGEPKACDDDPVRPRDLMLA